MGKPERTMEAGCSCVQHRFLVTCTGLLLITGNSYFIANSTHLRISDLAALSSHQYLRLLSMWYRWNFVKSFRWLQGPSCNWQEMKGLVVSATGKKTEWSLPPTHFHVQSFISGRIWLNCCELWTEETEFVGSIFKLNCNRNRFYKIHSNQHRSPPRLWKAKLPNSVDVLGGFTSVTCLHQSLFEVQTLPSIPRALRRMRVESFSGVLCKKRSEIIAFTAF